MNIPKGLLFLQKSSIIDVRLGSENIEVFKEKLGWSKLSRLLQRIAFSCCVTKKIGELESLLTKAEKFDLANISFLTSNFYGLPKVHKSKQITEAIQQRNNEYIEIHEPDDLTVRQIVGGPNCPARLLSHLIDIILKAFLIHIKSYVKDNLDFLRKCSRKNNDSTTLATFNVKSLYKSIPIIMALKQYVSG